MWAKIQIKWIAGKDPVNEINPAGLVPSCDTKTEILRD